TYGGFSTLPIASFLCAAMIMVIVYRLSRSRHQLSPLTLLLSGVVLNFICGSLILLIHYFSDLTQSFMMLRWTMGGLDVFDYQVLLNISPFILVGLIVLTTLSRYLNALSAGEDLAASRGVNVKRIVSLQFFGASLMTGSVIAFCGPIGFVGLIVPHTLRLLTGPDHRLLLPLSFVTGGTFLIFCDAIARTILAPLDIPVGIITSILGGPFFLWILLRRRTTSFL
ncbi:MAG: iron ABC transporter permease, partial [Acidobacteria bacterium]|nr:iron ABC transporter permease [Acidobacteriota bacterium]